MKRKVFILLLFLTAGSLYSQTLLKGLVTDETGKPLQGVLIIAESGNSGIITTESDETGKYTLELPGKGKYKLEFTLIGYDRTVKEISTEENILILYPETVKMKITETVSDTLYKQTEKYDNKDKEVRQDSLKNINDKIVNDSLNIKNETYETDVIDVVSELPEMTTEGEKKVFNIENLQSTTGGTALDVLRKIPMIDVDINDNVTLRGTKNVLILIDNKQMKFASLRQIPAETIKKVEIITNPSAKYEAEGVTGIINIVMKKAKPDVSGYNGNIFAGLRSNNGYYGFAGLNAKLNKWAFFGNGGGGLFKLDTKNNIRTDYFSPVSYFTGNSEGKGENKYGFFSAGIEYEIGKNINLGFDSYANLTKFENSGLTKNFNYDGGHNILSSSDFDLNSDGNYDNYFLSTYFNSVFDGLGKELNLDITYVKGNDRYDSEQDYRYYDIPGVTNPRLSNQLSVTNEKNYNLKIQGDYTHPFSGETRFEAGYKGIFRENDNDFRFDTLNFSSQRYITDLNLTNRFKLFENINAVYGTFSQKIRDFGFKMGLRLEHTLTKGYLVTNNSDFRKDYLNLFPTLSLTQKIGLQNEFQLSYSRRIMRPNIYRLNPFVNRSNTRFIYFGNPELNPEFTDSYEFGYSFFSNPVTVNTSFFYRRSYDVISNYSYQIDTITTATTYRNASGAKSYGIDLIISSRFVEWWNINANFSFYNTKFEGSVVSDYAQEEGSGWRGNIRSTFKIGSIFDVEVYYNYSGRRINANGFNEPMQNLDIGIKRSFFNNKLTLTLRAEDIFKTRKWEGETSGVGFRNYISGEWDSRLINLSISYRFGNTDKYYSKSKKTKANENEIEDVKEGR
ncbi:MAG: TonB-dependent receptor [Ignavibacteria bacterium]|nr:TonB-dependent receptor [Ignavibacteria bacterium]